MSSPSAQVGVTVTFTASGYAHGSLFTITWSPTGAPGGKVTACSGRTTSTGAFTCTYKIPPTAAGNYTFTGADAAAHTNTAVLQVLPTLGVSPNTGPVGSIVIVSGSAFGGSAGSSTVGVSVAWNGNTVCPSGTTTTNAYGNFTCAFALPSASVGIHQFNATDSQHHTALAAFTVTSRLSVSPSYGPGGSGYGPAGSTVRFTGTGFAPSAGVTLSWPVGTACAATTSTNGGFNCTYTIPSEAPGGVYSFQASDGVNHATVGFAVTFLHGSSSAATVGTNVTFTGGGFTPNSTITVTWTGGTLLAGPTNPSGGFTSFVFPVPSLASGGYTFHAVDGLGLSASFVLTVIPALQGSPTGGPPLTSGAWTLSGFAASSAFNVTWTAGTVCSGVTNATGGQLCPFTIPSGTTGGVYSFTATDAAGHVASATFTVTYLQALPPGGPVGDMITLSGGGFASSSGFNVTLASSVVCTGTTSPSGGIACAPYKILPSPAGPLTFVALDGKGNTASATFTVVPQISAKPTAGPVGTKVTFTGTGYGATASVSVSWARGTACTNNTSSSGSFTCAFVVPPAAAGPYSFAGIDGSGNTARTSFAVVPHLTAAPGAGAVGTVVALQATGFAAQVTITVSSPLGVACAGSTDGAGSFACSYTIPATPKGSLNLTAIDESSNAASVFFAVGAQLTVAPSTGPVGTVLGFAGVGFAAGSLVTVSSGSATACSATSTSYGSFSCAYVLPATTAGNHAFVGKDSAVPANSASVTFTVLPQLHLSRVVGAVGASVTFNGSGFATNSSVTVQAASHVVCSAVTGTFGGFGCAGTIPASTVGNLTVQAVDAASDAAFAAFAVVPALTISPTSGSVGTNLSFVGTGFAGGSAALVSWTRGTVCSATSAANGTFACSVAMPPAAAGPHLFNGTDAAGDLASATFSVVSSFNAGLTASPAGGPPGTVVTLQGTGFAAGVTVNVTWAAGLACSNLSDLFGSFSCKFAIPPATPGGAYSFSGSDGHGDSASASFVVTFLVAKPSSGPVGTSVTFTGGGFATSRSYTLQWTGGTVCSGTTTAAGSLSCTIAIPPTPSGTYKFVATDGAGTSANTSFRVLPVLGESVSRGAVGTSVTFTGSAYATSSPFTLSWSGGTACAGITDSSGSFACLFTVPGAFAGPHVFTGSDAAGNSSQVTFTVLASLVATPGSGPVGSSVVFTGAGYAASLTASVAGPAGTACSASADGTGAFACTIVVPQLAAGGYVFVGAEGSGLPTASATFTVTPHLTVVPVTGAAGTTLDFSATGFGSSVAITLLWTGGTVCTGTTSPAGAFGCSFPVPTALPGGNATFTAEDALGHVATVPFLVVPDLTATPSFGGPGATVTFAGVGFHAASPVSVTWAGGVACTATSDGTGTFQCSFSLPLGTSGGTYPFAAIDGAGNRATTSFVVTFLQVTPGRASVGTVLTFNGAGFAPDSSYAVTWFQGAACSGTVSGAGTFRCSYTLAESPVGPHTFTALDGAGDSATVGFVTVPALATSPGTGASGTRITFTGTGFAGNLSATVNWSGGVACRGNTSAAGSFSCAFVLTVSAIGLYRFTGTDAASNSANATFDVMLPATFLVTFSETGLPSRTNWTVTVNGVPETSNRTTALFNESNGVYSYSVRSAGWLASPGSGTFTVANATQSISVTFRPALYTVTFDQSGLAGVPWNVTLGSTVESTSGTQLSFSVPNGTYSYSVGAVPGFTVAPSAGSVTVAGTNPAAVPLAFTQVEYTLTFNATGLPSGRSWSVTLNGVTASSITTSISFLRPNGTYSFVARATGYTPTPGGGSYTVNGANPAAFVFAFARVAGAFTVTFSASGIGPAVGWTVTFNGTPVHALGASLTVNEPNGNYTWSVVSPGYRIAPNHGTVTVAGANPAPIALVFTAVTYRVQFNEVGLPNGSFWIVTVFPGTSLNQSAASISFQLANGSYFASYRGPAGYIALVASNQFNVTAAPLSFSVLFVPLTSLAVIPPATFLGFTGNTGYYILGGAVAGGVAAAGVLGYFWGRRKKVKTIGSDFL